MRRCIFCHEPLGRNRAREHVLPRWLEREIGGEFAYYSHPITGDTGTEFTLNSTDVISATASTRVEGRVCADCNNTWLNSLEAAARPVVSATVFGRQAMESISEADRLILAAWAYKTLLVGVSSGDGDFDIHGCDFHQFRATGMPGDWVNIYAAVLESDCPGFCGPAELKWPWPPGYPVGEAEPDCAELGLKWVYHIGNLHVVACHVACSDLVQNAIEGLHFPLWTPQSYSLQPGRLSPEVESNSLLKWLAFGLVPTLRLPQGGSV